MTNAALDSVRENHESWRIFYKAMGMEELFFHKFWDGFDNFEDYVRYGDIFHHIEIDENQLRQREVEERAQMAKEFYESY